MMPLKQHVSNKIKEERMRNILMSEEGDGGECGGLLSTVLSARGGHDGGELLAQRLLHPQTTSSIEECRELSDGTTVTLDGAL